MARKILLADDSVTAQNMGRKILADAGYEVIAVNNGSAALKKIAELKPDLIILDVYMPGYSGLEVCQRLKDAQETARIPVLLTVGKLEPFKPEEAKRVRAEGFIVKPFEASELLSALAKLEDKIVPRSEPKQGRFARAIAAVEESGASDNVEGDSSWKSRISFPKKKKKKAEDEEEENGEVAATAKPAAKDASAVNAVSLPAGLPRDVTPEEIAAIAAAAAHVQGVVSAARESAEEVGAKPVAYESPVAAPGEEAQAVVARAEEKSESESRNESKSEPVKAESQEQSAAAFREAAAAAESDVPATFAGAASEEKPELSATAEPASQKEAQPEAPSHADVIAAIAALEPANGSSWAKDPEPDVAPSVETAAPNYSGGPRWTAVPSQLDASEAGMSLEHEMQKAYAAFAAAEANQPGFIHADAHAPAPAPAAEEAQRPQEWMSVQAAVVEAAAQYPNSEPELAQAVSAVANVSVEAVAAAAAELAAVAASLSRSQSPAPVEIAPTTAEPGVETPAQTVAEVTSQPVAETPAQAEAAIEAPQPVAASEEPAPVEVRDEKVPEPAAVVEEPVAAKTEEEPVVAQIVAPVVAQAEETPQANLPGATSTPEAQPVPPAAEVAAQTNEESRGTAHAEGPHSESALHATTAAAWATWRQIRETDGTYSKRRPEDAPASSPDGAAMAAAAGAEKSPAENPADANDPAIANMVESVLAGLRPKIAAEISRKLGEKK